MRSSKNIVKLFVMLHKARYTQAHEPITPVTMDYHMGTTNTKVHLSWIWVSSMRNGLLTKMLINTRLLSSQLLQIEAREVEEDISLHKEWKDQESFIVNVETAWGITEKNPST